jgi:hypothetical protein
MKRSQIQLPDRLYERLKKQAADEESRSWIPPDPVNLGAFLASEDRWRELAHDGEAAP